MSAEVQRVVEDLGRAFEQFKAARDAELAELKAKGVADPLITEKVERISADLTKFQGIKDRLDAMEKRMNRPGYGGQKGSEWTEDQIQHRDAFVGWLRNPTDSRARADLQQIQKKAVTVGTAAAGGHALPEILVRQIEQKLLDVSPMRQVAMVETYGSSDVKKLVDTRGGGYGWAGEGDTRSETTTPQLSQVAPTFGILYSYPKTSEEALQDIFFDVEQWLVNESVDNFAKGEGIAFITGNGTSKPTGFLSGTPESATDEADSPARTFGELQYIATGVAAAFPQDRLGSPAGNPGDVLMDTIYALKAGYRGNARWTMNKTTLGVVRKWKDADGHYIWQPGLQVGQPGMIAGYPVTEMEDMPDIGANAFPVAFGDFSGYWIVDLAGIRITTDEITTPGQVKFYVRKRVGGKLLNDDKIKVVKCSTS